MGDRIAVMNVGVLQQVGTPEELYTNPRNVVRRGVHRLAGDEPRARAAASDAGGAGPHRRLPARAHAARARRRGRATSFDARVEVVEYLGDEQLVHLVREGHAAAREAAGRAADRDGRDEQFAVARDKVVLFDAETEERVG